MSCCYSGDHIVGDHIHTDITTYNIEEPQKNSALELSIIDYSQGGGGLNMFYWIQFINFDHIVTYANYIQCFLNNVFHFSDISQSQ